MLVELVQGSPFMSPTCQIPFSFLHLDDGHCTKTKMNFPFPIFTVILLLLLSQSFNLVAALYDKAPVGEWQVRLRGGRSFDPSTIFPLTNGNSSLTYDMTVNPRRWLWRSQLDCTLTLYQNGTFAFSPTPQNLNENSHNAPIQLPFRQPRLDMRGHWTLFPNPYCHSDRFYDQLELKSYTRVAVSTRATNNGMSTITHPLNMQDVCRSGTFHLSCRLFTKSNVGGRKENRLTHGTLVWKEDTNSPKKFRFPGQVMASFSAQRMK